MVITKAAIEYPEHEKLRKISQISQLQGDFLDWLLNEKGYELVETNELDVSKPVQASIRELLAEYHGIDLTKLDDEKDKIYQELKHRNER